LYERRFRKGISFLLELLRDDNIQVLLWIAPTIYRLFHFRPSGIAYGPPQKNLICWWSV
jgi:hypothetical protein